METPKRKDQVAEIELVYHPIVKPCDQPQMKDSRHVSSMFRAIWHPGHIALQEEFKLMLLSRANRVLGIVSLSLGGLTSTIVDPRLVFAAALKAGASAIILAHNHPSGALSPSGADLALTSKIGKGAELLDIQLLDHLILTTEGYFSFADDGIL